VTDSPLRHHHLKTANIPRRGDLYTSRIPMLFNQDMTAYRAKPAKAYDKFEYYKNGGADEIIFVFKGGGVVETLFGKLPYRAEDYIVIPRGITYRIVPNEVEEADYLILESSGPVRIPPRYLNHDGHIKMGSRRGIESGSITLHPRGIPHGPHPGTIMASKNATRTEELAVMFDTQHTLELTEESLALDDPKYPQSWLD